MSQSLRDLIKQGLTEATKAQDKRRMATLRLIQAALKDRDIAGRTDGRDAGVSDAEILEVLSKMVKQRRESVGIYESAGRMELAQQENEEIKIIESFMPKQLSDEETAAAVEAVIAETGAASIKDMGRVMGELKKRHSGQMDFAKAGAIVKEKLA
ncbi:GatB/YqeY domain-containing protein [Parvibaculum sp.]|uniref:GatB/YqeY domain-containing protein n=1 Tax=Parvibaculum sp. TaxID=2024848 RepID=UPI000C4CE2CD|nr:GatB/YqeY domain-containing protein [Parvibaculum sp.]HAC60015.1 glutamyl-tRNA amidotransferase [Rhodobiaceae bacterium]MAU59851.1 glutamyl-tRNA amidotransferase [Parvibaculum sp.]MBO6667647.1 GatB/YqeY domain-containing protein [Parvibaculum sp.]MBO6693261.1 GatB/YqeY domain-containing protein [Parvibaculum sp.]MBO6715268.1 GatB/YqeY domain-containing protein [Parvibaculum sp.]|tara:strand:- start:2248 stop:2712 length:465 start_codon:yes stop_codon:yes gene_type:complete